MLLPTSEGFDDFADRLRMAREEADMTQMELAQKLGKTHQSYVGNFETGVSKAKGLEVVVQFALALNVTVDYLAGLTNEPKGRSKDNLPSGAAEILTEFERLSDVGREEIVEELKRIAAHDAERRADISQQQAYAVIFDEVLTEEESKELRNAILAARAGDLAGAQALARSLRGRRGPSS